MFLIDHAPQAARRTRKIGHSVGTLVFELCIEPRGEARVVYSALSSLILKHTWLTMEERTMMHLYAHSVVCGDGSRPLGIDPGLVSKVDGMVIAQRHHFHQHHPIMTRLLKAA